MIQTLDRATILEINTTFKDFIVEIQKALQTDKIDIDAINLSKANKKYYGNATFTFIEKDIVKYLDAICATFEKLTQVLNWNNILILSTYETKWLHKNDSYLITKSVEYLKTIIKNKNFSGGFNISQEELGTFIKNIFAIIRFRAGFPDIYFCGEKSKTIINICQYGNLHFDFYSLKEKKLITKKIKEFSFKEIDSYSCYNQFDNNLGINGRLLEI